MTDQPDSIQSLKKFTDARIGLGRTGNSIPTKESLAFNLAHAHARDAVYSLIDIDELTNQLKQFNLPVIPVCSQAQNRPEYLQRPDLGRRLADKYIADLNATEHFEIAIIVADGLSAEAINLNLIPFLEILIPKLLGIQLKLSPIVLVEQGRVAIADEIGSLLKASLSIILIGERPGLSAADSMGAYLTYNPKIGLTDDARNCVSNIRPQGLNFELAADKIFYLVNEALRRKLTGVDLKDHSGLLGT